MRLQLREWNEKNPGQTLHQAQATFDPTQSTRLCIALNSPEAETKLGATDNSVSASVQLDST